MAEARFTDDVRPMAVDDTETALFDGEAVVFRVSTKAIHRLNATAGAVWVCCDGDSTVAAIVDDLADAFGTDAHSMRPLVLDALAQLTDLGLLIDPGHPVAPSTPADLTAAPTIERASDGSRIVSCPPDT